ncbi:alpha/beta hydrolase [Levilactobacillus cerevisiae]|uniref:alpha/beta hydrolase n=1 Tax=Levilactobacillus cerevisiae TaxID=1704076 RepID=UPI000F777C0E|nr:alpha/beta hydrolase [Levilactobacillus cerevisiae]
MRKLLKWGWGTLLALSIVLAGSAVVDSQKSSAQTRVKTQKVTELDQSKVSSATKKAVKKTKQTAKKRVTGYATPTLFMHGFTGNAGSTNNLIDSAQADGYATRTLLATVGWDGHVSFSGTWNKSDRHPEVQIVFKNNRNRNYQQDARWLKHVIKKLQRRYGITKFNYVGHSMGNTDIMAYETTFGQRKQLPQLQKYVAIAPAMLGNIVMFPWTVTTTNATNGRPSEFTPEYQKLVNNRKTIPLNQIRVLSLYGNLDNGTDTDGTISVSSAKSLRYLFWGRSKSFKEVELTGDLASHNALPRRNPEVVRDMEHFLWG